MPCGLAPLLPPSEEEAEITVELLPYKIRRVLTARDPTAVIHAFTVQVLFVLPRLCGVRVCPNCPHCNADDAVILVKTSLAATCDLWAVALD